MPLPLSSPPDSVCLLRLSALGDITHCLPVLRTLQRHWPDTAITWIIGRNEHELVRRIEGVEFVTFDKGRGLAAYGELRRKLAGRRFDVLLHMQVALRASAASLFTRADVRVGFDRPRAKDMQWLFCNAQIQPRTHRQHVLDGLLEFPKRLGLEPVMQWGLPSDPDARVTLSDKLGGGDYLVINACAVAKSRSWRNWTVEGYAMAADHAAREHGLQVVLSGGPSPQEREMADRIEALCNEKPLNLVGRTSLQEMIALLEDARMVIAPDTGPAHVASAVGTPVIGLYAATNPDRAAPYRFRQYVVNEYPRALETYCSTTVDRAAWGQRIRNDECMALIQVRDVLAMMDRVAADSGA